MKEIFPACKADTRNRVAVLSAEQARISDITQPFHRQPSTHDFELHGSKVRLYDGFKLQYAFAQTIPEWECTMDHLHIIFTDLLVCTFSEDDCRYHARSIICGMPCIISIPGIIEAPAKPREFYFNLGLGLDVESAKKSIVGRYLDYDDDRISDAATNYALQALFFLLTGKPFCDDVKCRLFNAHWQEELIRILQKPTLCQMHLKIACKFNERLVKTQDL